MEKCIVCNIKFEKIIPSTSFGNKKLNDKLSVIYRKILGIFCTHFNLPFKQNENQNKADCETQEENETSPSFPFCVECRNLVAELCIFHEKLESIQKIIQKTVAKITIKILHSEKNLKNPTCSNSTLQNEEEKENRDEFSYRQKIIQNFSPRVLLTRCQNQEPTPKQKVNCTTVQKSSGDLNKDFINDNHHDNDKDSQDDDKNANDGSSQVEKSMETEASNSPPAPEKRVQNLMEKIRCGSWRKNSHVPSAQVEIATASEAKSASAVTQSFPLLRSMEERRRELELKPGETEQVGGMQNRGVLSSVGFTQVRDDKFLHTSGKWSFEQTEFGWKCGSCPKMFGTVRIVRKHMELWHIPGDFKCKFCPRSFSRPAFLRIHRCGFGVEMNKYTCEISPGKFVYNGKWEFFKAPDGHFQCSVCSATRKIKEGLAFHIKSVHDSPDLQCEVCGRCIKTKGELNKHVKTHSAPNERFKCPEKDCAFSFPSKSGLWFHQRRKHNAPPKKPILEKKFPCEQPGCPKKFVSPIYLKRHLESHEKIFICLQSQCRERFATVEEMETHYKTHKLPNQEDSDEGEEVGENGEENGAANSKSREKSTGEKRQWKRGRKKHLESETESESENEEEIEEVELSEDEERNEDEEDAEVTTEESEPEPEPASKNDSDGPVYTIL